MCGRYYLETDTDLAEIRALLASVQERFRDRQALSQMRTGEIFPTQIVPVIRSWTTPEGDRLLPDLMQWGFTGRSLLINARAETCEIRPTFRDSFRTRRALVPATAFFEWQPKDPARPEGSRVKLKLWRREELVFYMAALYRPLPADKNPFDLTGQFVILTSRSNRSLAAIHDRMPLIVPRPLLRAYLQDEAVARTLLGEDVAADFIAEPAGPAGTP